MTTMFGIPKSKIHKVKNPYKPTEILKKFDEESTAFVTVVGEKDKNRLGGKYFQPYKGEPSVGYRDGGYVYAAPSSGGGISGTETRNGLSVGSDEQKKDFFKKRAYGKFNATIFKMITDKLNEGVIEIPKERIEEWLINESSKITTGQVDDGPNFFFPNYDVFSRINVDRATRIGYEVINMITSKEIEDYYDHPTYPDGPVKAVTYFPAGVLGTTTATNQVDIYSSKAYSDWFKHSTRAASMVGYELVKGLGVNKDEKEISLDAQKGDKESQEEYEASLNEVIKLPVKVGDTILTGRFKNKKTVVKTIGKDEHGMPTINGKKVVTFRLMKEGFFMEVAGTAVKCEKCNHSWDIESEDDEKYLCHSCGWDSQKQEYDFDAFDSWKEKMGLNEELDERSKGKLRPADLLRRKAKMAGKRAQIARRRARTMKRRKSLAKLKKIAYKKAYLQVYDEFRQELFPGIAKKDLSIQQAKIVHKNVLRKKKRVLKRARFRFLPQLRDAEAQKFSKKDEMSKSTLNKIEKYAEKQLSPEDIEFTKHFFDRINDPRNGTEISDAELTGFFKRLSKDKKQFRDVLEKYKQSVVTDKRNSINIPFVKQANQIIAKTVMRKDDFKTSNPKLAFEMMIGYAGPEDMKRFAKRNKEYRKDAESSKEYQYEPIKEQSDRKTQCINNFVEYACKRLNLKETPKITLMSGTDYADTHKSLGGFNPQTKEIFCATEGRLTADICRTIAHELVHRKQDELGLLKDPVKDGKDGTDIENQANAVAGIIMREYGRIDDTIYQEGVNDFFYMDFKKYVYKNRKQINQKLKGLSPKRRKEFLELLWKKQIGKGFGKEADGSELDVLLKKDKYIKEQCERLPDESEQDYRRRCFGYNPLTPPPAGLQRLGESTLKLRIPNDVKKIHKAFKKNGKKLYVVGGAVRDAILGKSPKDFDVATDAKPDEVIKIAKDNGIETKLVGKRFGVVIWIINGVEYEVATFRKDIGKGRRPDRVDYTDIHGDVKRRDLTVNALFYDIDRKEIVDLVGGIEDLKKKKIRTVGKAKERFDEDPLRKLRALRFWTRLGGTLDKDLLDALQNDPSLKGVSAEAIREEFLKSIKSSKNTKKFMEMCDKVGFTSQIFPNLKISKPYINDNDYILFIASLLKKNTPSVLGKQLNKLSYSNDDKDNIVFLVLLQHFKPEEIVKFKKLQQNTSLSDNQIITFGKLIGKDMKKFVNFNLSVGGKDVPSDIKGAEIGLWIKNKEKENFLSEDSNPNAHPQGKNKLTNRTTVMDMLDVISHKEFRGKDYDKLSDSEKKKVLKVAKQQKFIKEGKEVITEGGAYGHMSHPFDTDINLTFGQLKDIVNRALEGTLEFTREKTDGQALAISWRDGRLVAARNKGHLKNKGENALDIKGVSDKFQGRGGLSDAYNYAMKDLSNAISSLTDKQRDKIFKQGACCMNLEVIYPTSVNVIPYGQALLVFHGTMEYNDEGVAIGENGEAARILAGMIKQVNKDVQDNYTIQGPPVVKLPKSQDLSKKRAKYSSQISKLQKEFGLKDTDGVANYHQAWWEQFVDKKSPSTLDNKTKMGLVKRWAFMDKKFRLDNKNISDSKTLEWAKKTDKDNHKKISKDNLMKFEKIFLGLGAEVLEFTSSALTVNPDKAVRDIKKRIDKTIKDVKKSGDPKKIEKLKLELGRLNSIGGQKKIVPNEGIVFLYKGNTFKLTGTFASVNQILGIFF